MVFKRGVSVLFLLAAACVAEAYSSAGRALLQGSTFQQSASASSDDEGGSASSGNTLIITEGSGEAISVATSQSAAESFSKIQEIVNGVVGKLPKGRRASKKQICREAAVAVEESASALASVGVRVSVSTFTTITIDGVGEGCGSADASGSASATAFAEAIVEAWAIARNIQNIASAQASLNAVVRALATASASASAQACITADGSRDAPSFAEAFQDLIVEAYTKASASILVWLEAVVDCAGEGETFVEAIVDASLRDPTTIFEGTTSTIVEGVGTTNVDANATARVEQSLECSTLGDLSRCCRDANINSADQKCFCTFSGIRPSSPTCEADLVITDGIVFWQYTRSDGSAGTCQCS